MGARSAEKQILDWGAVTRPIEHRAHGEQLIERKFAVKDVAAAKSIGFIEVKRRDDLAMQDFVWQIRGVLSHGVDDSLAKSLPSFAPSPLF